ncbi:extracellular solute-binding protein [Streptomyces cavernae]|uniref:extracellular solute-binding protein n=1 Tax=Streptomyces cavernae TaxID=2259034 RepID=UPI000FEBB4FA|nr:extracellular solute-binding protein [Streptomyces cavernae]
MPDPKSVRSPHCSSAAGQFGAAYGVGGRQARALASVAAVASLSLVLAACWSGEGSDSAAKADIKVKVTLEFWSWTDGIEAQTKVWNKEHPDTQIKFVNAAGEAAYQRLRAAVNAGTAPCPSKMDGMNLANFAADGMLTDITKVAGGAP